jgi:hypothetical protein
MLVAGNWNDIDCNFKQEPMVTLCEVVDENNFGKCSTKPFVKADGKQACGFYLEKGLFWQQANKRCQAAGGRLPEIKSPEENSDIFHLMVCLFISAFINYIPHGLFEHFNFQSFITWLMVCLYNSSLNHISSHCLFVFVHSIFQS